MAVFLKSQKEEAKSLKNKLTETQKKPETIEERFVIGEIDRAACMKNSGLNMKKNVSKLNRNLGKQADINRTL